MAVVLDAEVRLGVVLSVGCHGLHAMHVLTVTRETAQQGEAVGRGVASAANAGSIHAPRPRSLPYITYLSFSPSAQILVHSGKSNAT